MGISLAEHYWLLLKVNDIACTISNPVGIFQEVCRVMQDIVPCDRGCLSLYDSSSQRLKIAASFDAQENDSCRISHVLSRPTTHMVWVFEHKTTLLCRNLEKEFRFADDKNILDAGYISVCSAPLMVREKSLGVMSVLASRKNQLSANHAGVLEEISKPIALAICSMITMPPMPSNRKAAGL